MIDHIKAFILTLCLLVNSPLPTIAQTKKLNQATRIPPNYPTQTIFENIKTEDGLPSRNTWFTLKDRQGFIWFSTQEGLVRYDGLNFRVFRHNTEDSSSLSANQLWSIIEDKLGFIWIGTHNGGLNRFDPTTEKFERIKLPNLATSGRESISQAPIWRLMEDHEGQIWVSTRGEGIYVLNQRRDSIRQFKHDPQDPSTLSSNLIHEILQDSRGQYWIATGGGGLNLFDPESGTAIHFKNNSPGNRRSDAQNILIDLEEDANHDIWITTFAGISRFDPETATFENFFYQEDNSNSLSDNHCIGMLIDSQQKIWIATAHGLNYFDPETRQFQHFFHDHLNAKSLVHNDVHRIYEDDQRILWITTSNGISVLNPHWKNFQQISLARSISEIEENIFDVGAHQILEDHDGNIWMATHFDGLYRYDPFKDEYFHFTMKNSNLNSPRIWCLDIDSAGNIWIGSAAGLQWFDPQQQKFYSFCENKTDLCRLISNLEHFRFDSKGNFWIGNESGLIKINPLTKDFKLYSGSDLAIRNIMAIDEDRYGSLWIGGEGGGLQWFNPANEKFGSVDPGLNFSENLAPTHHPDFMIDSQGLIWVFSQAKLRRFQPDSLGNLMQLNQWPISGGKIFEDHTGKFWIVQNYNVLSFDPGIGLQNEYSLRGITQPLDHAFTYTRSGAVYLAGYQKLFRFYPHEFKINNTVPEVVFTKFALLNQQNQNHNGNGNRGHNTIPFPQSIGFTKKIKLRHANNDFSMSFSALNYIQAENNQYKYILKGYNEDTIRTDAAQASATYTNLAPGHYEFLVWGTNNYGVWSKSPATMQLHITAPWYWSWWSKLIYLMLILVISYTFYRTQLYRQIAVAKSERLEELDAFKTQFYTNMTHEFRTPLTVISGMADQVLQNPKQYFRDGLDMIKRNSQQLLTLVNQMLDLSKLESGMLKINPVLDDLIAYLRYLLDSFHSYAAAKDIRLHFLPEISKLYMDFDPEKIETIFTNLISNSIKFTPEGGDIYLKIRKRENDGEYHFCEIIVADNGVGISSDALPYIFDRFYQGRSDSDKTHQGTGIGLALTKELVHVMGGKIEVESKPGQGTSFFVKLPITHEAPMNKVAMPKIENANDGHDAMFDQSNSNEAAALPTALLIEDNPDVLKYLSACLEGKYKLILALDGKKGIEIAFDMIPDVIISDVMMPEVDGFALVQTLKTDERTSHIPIILLSAKADLDSRVEGLQRGADAYLTKPFHQEELQVRLEKLIELRKQLQQRYATLSPDDAPKNLSEQIEDRFILRAKSIVERNLADEHFKTVQLAEALHLSRSQLHRKLHALTGNSTSHFIRSIRLQKAKTLLENTDLQVSEIAYAVGFTNRSHFTQVFSAEFGEAPSFYRNGV